MQRGQRNAVVLSDIGGQRLLGYARHEQVGPSVNEVNVVLLRRNLGNNSIASEIALIGFWSMRTKSYRQQLLVVPPVGDRGKPRRLNEGKHVRRDRHSHAHVVTAAQ